MKTVEYYEIMEEKDKNEGRGGLSATGVCFSDREDALTFTKSPMMGRYVAMGYINPDGSSWLIQKRNGVIFESYQECLDNYEHAMTEKKKQAALSKLTDEEKKVLGLV